MGDVRDKVLVVAQTARAARCAVRRLLGHGRGESQIVVLLQSSAQVAGCRVRTWDDYVPPKERAAEVTRLRQALDAAAEGLRDAFTCCGLFLYDAWRPNFFHFFLDRLVALTCVVHEALRRERPAELCIAEDPGVRSWWTGRERLAEVAHALAGDAGVRVRVAPGAGLRLLRDAFLWPAPLVLTLAWAAGAWVKSAALRIRGRRVEAAGASHRPRVLLAVYGAAELDIIEVLRDELSAVGCARVEVVDLGFANTASMGRQRGWAVGDLAAHSTVHSLARGLCAPFRAWTLWRRVTGERAWQSSFGLLDASLWPAAAARARATAIPEFARTLLYGAIADELLRRVAPDVLVMFKRGSSVAAGLVLSARELRIPSLYVQHGLLSDPARTQPHLPYDRFLAFSEHAREQIAAGGILEETIEVVGHAGYDALARAIPHRAADRESHPLTHGARHVLLLLTQPGEGLRGMSGGRWAERVFEAVSEISGCRLIVKMHPRDTKASAYEELGTRAGADVRIVRHSEAKLQDLWPLCDAVVTGHSTAAFEAIIFGKPVVSVNLTGGPDLYPFAASGAALGAREPGEILPALRAALSDESTRRRLAGQRGKFIERHVGPLDGRSAKRMADAIMDAARRHMHSGPDATMREVDSY